MRTEAVAPRPLLSIFQPGARQVTTAELIPRHGRYRFGRDLVLCISGLGIDKGPERIVAGHDHLLPRPVRAGHGLGLLSIGQWRPGQSRPGMAILDKVLPVESQNVHELVHYRLQRDLPSPFGGQIDRIQTHAREARHGTVVLVGLTRLSVGDSAGVRSAVAVPVVVAIGEGKDDQIVLDGDAVSRTGALLVYFQPLRRIDAEDVPEPPDRLGEDVVAQVGDLLLRQDVVGPLFDFHV
mmetsp:Transcript_20345/g.48040  ORF Transcript_20345/g.48040 Transcript_20345/m.48040 type:complete len:238 (+) Transcript_20345:1045-1758(+)